MNNSRQYHQIYLFCLSSSSELSKARLHQTNLLVDWESIRLYKQQLTDIDWYFDNYGPFVNTVHDVAIRDPQINVISTYTMYGTLKTLFSYIGDTPEIPENIKNIIDEVIIKTRSMYWNEFIDYVYSTPPIQGSNRYTYLNLIEFINYSK